MSDVCFEVETEVSYWTLYNLVLAIVAATYLRPANNHLWGHWYSCLALWAHLVFHGLQPSTFHWMVTHLCPDLDCVFLTSVIGLVNFSSVNTKVGSSGFYVKCFPANWCPYL